ncbi:hypothetical protein LP420_08140 [Massilia sp. B-10]|nr:hypothetical protein LP420_08140 [Massilia sp. B-10]
MAQHVGNAVDLLLQFTVAPARCSPMMAVRSPPRLSNGGVEQFGHAVQAFRILQFGQVEAKFRPQVRS